MSPAARARLIGILAEAVGAQGLAKGQYQDLYGGVSRTVADITATNTLKTSALLEAAVEMAAVVANADGDVTQSLRDFARAAEQAFQIGDDFLDQRDAVRTMHQPGKDTGKDIDKATLLNSLGTEKTRQRMTALMRQAHRHLRTALGPQSQTRRMLSALLRGARR